MIAIAALDEAGQTAKRARDGLKKKGRRAGKACDDRIAEEYDGTGSYNLCLVLLLLNSDFSTLRCWVTDETDNRGWSEFAKSIHERHLSAIAEVA